MESIATQQARFKKLIKKVNMSYIGMDAADIQKIAMLVDELCYKGQDYEEVTEQIFEVNINIELFGNDDEKFPMHETWGNHSSKP